MIFKALVVGQLAVNCYIIGDENTKEGIVVDPGGDAAMILEVVRGTGLTIKYIVITHGHFDHCGALKSLKDTLKCEILAHKEDLPVIQRSKASAQRWGLDVEQAPDPDRFIDEKETIIVGSLEFSVLHTPGHSPGGISLYLASESLLLSGDTLFHSSIGRTDFPGGSMAQLTSSLQQKIYTLPDTTKVYSGHGEPTTIEYEKRHNMFVRER
jgi:glyoxylase-like metal-dependent hydrolase (beta-lactamase superfamily II)